LLQQKVPWSAPDISVDEEEAVSKVMISKWLGMGPKTRELEQNICSYVNVRNSVAVNNGTSALIASLIANGIEPGDKVLVPTYTFIATVNSVLAIGAQPILVDCDPNTFNVSAETIQDCLEKNTDVKSIIFVDVAGMPADIDAIREFAHKKNIIVIEDAAEAFGAQYKNKSVGNYDHTTVFSFHIAKQMTTIEGGAIATNDDEVAERVRLIRNHGEGKQKYVHTEFGLNLRPTDIHSAIGLAQIRKVERYIQLRKKIAEMYISDLGNYFEFQHMPDYVSRHPWMLFMCMTRDRSCRDELNSYLNNKGVDTRLPWPPANSQPYHKRRLGEIRCPNAEGVFERIISLPIGNHISESEVETVIQVVKDFFETKT
jgi:perosamine synthetase